VPDALRILRQSVAYIAFVAAIAYLSAEPAYQHVDPERAVIRLVISHATAKVGECRQLSPEEFADLAPNMRRPTECPRERHNLFIELRLDDELLYQGVEPPTGLWKDGPSNVYRKFIVPSGRHQLAVRFRDSGRESGFDHEYAKEIALQPQQNFVVGFRSATGISFGEG
jgi:hypothetical protein